MSQNEYEEQELRAAAEFEHEAQAHDVLETGEFDEEEVVFGEDDIVFDCPRCGHNLVIDQRGAGLMINCAECNEPVQVPIPEGIELTTSIRSLRSCWQRSGICVSRC